MFTNLLTALLVHLENAPKNQTYPSCVLDCQLNQGWTTPAVASVAAVVPVAVVDAPSRDSAASSTRPGA